MFFHAHPILRIHLLRSFEYLSSMLHSLLADHRILYRSIAGALVQSFILSMRIDYRSFNTRYNPRVMLLYDDLFKFIFMLLHSGVYLHNDLIDRDMYCVEWSYDELDQPDIRFSIMFDRFFNDRCRDYHSLLM